MRTIQVSEMIDEQKFNRFHLQILLCCIFIIICDGYDMFMLGTILPSLMAEWRITAVEAGLFSGHALGGVVASLGAMYLIPNFGWRAVVWLGAFPYYINCCLSQ
ncbi:MFS transporter [Peribacillus frigoritolerans]|uniref:hypothetical protein n=1 Tax=Peribacillus castrilensis TaxID=2897690 RepID=UPI00296E734A|nr:hypothetical protein [Peribacillus castrilensis]